MLVLLFVVLLVLVEIQWIVFMSFGSRYPHKQCQVTRRNGTFPRTTRVETVSVKSDDDNPVLKDSPEVISCLWLGKTLVHPSPPSTMIRIVWPGFGLGMWKA